MISGATIVPHKHMDEAEKQNTGKTNKQKHTDHKTKQTKKREAAADTRHNTRREEEQRKRREEEEERGALQ